MLVLNTLQCSSVTPGAAAKRTRFWAPERLRERARGSPPSSRSDHTRTSSSSSRARSESGKGEECELFRFWMGIEAREDREGRGTSAGCGVRRAESVGVEGCDGGVDRCGITAAICRREGRGGRGGGRRVLFAGARTAYGFEGSLGESVGLEGPIAGLER